MLAIAKVVVDVATQQTNQAYDYEIPDQLKDYLGIGFRVRVPFGTRNVLGYIVDVVYVEKANYKLRPISEVLDTYPVLTPELIELGQRLASETYAFYVSTFQTILPSLLKANYEKTVTWLGPEEGPKAWAINQEKPYDEVVQMVSTYQILKWQKEGKIQVNYLVKDKKTIKTNKWVHLLPGARIDQISKQAPKQQLLFQALEKHSPLMLAQLKSLGISLANVRALESKGLVKVEEVQENRDPYKARQFEKSLPKTLTPAQNQVFQAIREKILKQEHETFLLEGVTGSGKTEIYLQLIAQAIAKGKTAIMLVPEISLTPQMAQQFKARFGDRVAVLHSGLSDGERFDEWSKLRQKKADIVVGARSSVFAPLDNIGLIIIDEEHESSYKQMDSVRYHARQVALMRGRTFSCPVVLGSATPSLESRARAQKKVYQLLELKERVNQRPLPQVEIIDMTQEKKVGNFDIFSQVLKEAIEDRLAKDEQVVLLLNRRGYSAFAMCRDCGYVVQCPNCDISLTLHKASNSMKCHYCGHQEAVPRTCPNCHKDHIRFFGMGTQRVEEELMKLFPQAGVIRMDVDTTQKKGQHEKLLKAFGDKKASILLGTQMIAKGLDFPDVTLVGVINADTSLYLPDFRSAERTFQLLTQVAGRAGRSQKPGEVIIQTYNPDHYVLQLAQKHDYENFYKQEMVMRHMGDYPPYYFATLLTISSTSQSQALQLSYQVKDVVDKLDDLQVLCIGPAASVIGRVNNRYYFQILLKYKKPDQVRPALEEIQGLAKKMAPKKVYISIDVDPMNFM